MLYQRLFYAFMYLLFRVRIAHYGCCFTTFSDYDCAIRDSISGCSISEV